MTLRTFSIQTLGCKVNQYEAEQMAAALVTLGLTPAPPGGSADLRLIHTCSVTMQAGAKSRQIIRRTAQSSSLSLPVLGQTALADDEEDAPQPAGAGRTVVTGCWATENPQAARNLPGVDAVLTHHDDVAAGLRQLLHLWGMPGTPASEPSSTLDQAVFTPTNTANSSDESPSEHNRSTRQIQQTTPAGVNGKIALFSRRELAIGTTALPLLGDRQTGRQRALLKVQDGCDAHCTYCIIPRLRPRVWSKPIDDAVEEARRLTAAGHVELVLTGIFLGAYGHDTALRRRQDDNPGPSPLARLIDALCTRVPDLRRVRLSSLEPGDLTDDLVAALQSHPQVVPHFHLPLQSGSEALLRRMNRQYGRDDFLRMLDRVNAAFDRPALTTDIICGFPGETDAEFDRTLEVVEAARFIHVHAFAYSQRPGTAAARWTKDFIHGPVVNDRINALRAAADRHSLAFRKQFVGETVELLVEREREDGPEPVGPIRHGRSERYFPVWFEDPTAMTGDFVKVKIESVTPTRTHGQRNAFGY